MHVKTKTNTFTSHSDHADRLPIISMKNVPVLETDGGWGLEAQKYPSYRLNTYPVAFADIRRYLRCNWLGQAQPH